MTLKIGNYRWWSPPPRIEESVWVTRGRRENERRRQEAEKRILAAIEQLQLDGIKITVRSVHAEAGGGSFSTICRVLKEWQESKY